MDVQQFSDWLTSTSLSQAIQLKLWAIPSIQTVHILALSLLFAAALIVALRFWGAGLAVEALPMLVRRFVRFIWLLLAILVVTGALLIIAEPYRTLANPIFFLKMALLVVAVLLTAWLGATAKREPSHVPALHRAAAALTVLLWIGIMFAGRLIAYYDPY